MSSRSRRVTATTIAVVVLVGAAVFVASKAFAPPVEPPATAASATPTTASPASEPSTPRPSASTTPTATAPTTAPTPTPTPTTRTRTLLTVSYSGYDTATSSVQASGYIDLIETGGSCTLTLTSGSKTASGSHAASTDATTTSCGAVQVPRSALAAGTWDGVLSYSSPTTVAESPHFSVSVP